jgi:methyl halide transferase
MNTLNEQFWTGKYQNGETGWDLGQASPPIIDYFKKNKIAKNTKILIPGCGFAYEAEYLLQKGYKNITLVDISTELVINLLKKFEKEVAEGRLNVICADFLQFFGKYDLIIEQTFFCALNPDLRADYVKKIFELLSDNGKLIGLLFNINFDSGPPFGGNEKEYHKLFDKKFKNVSLTPSTLSAKPRAGSELWMEISNI